MGRPENQLPPELYYNQTEASKYESNTRIQQIQREMTERCIELLNVPAPAYILDVGCGSALSGQMLTESGYIWEGIDISADMLNIAASKKVAGGLFQVDMGQGFKVRAGTFDGTISVSALQWLCVASKKNDNPFRRCCRFFQTLYESMASGARAVFQFYPDGRHQLEMITTAALKSGFSGGLVVDYPNSTKAKKHYLVLEAGANRNLGIVEIKGKQEADETISEDESEEGEKQDQEVENTKAKYNEYQCRRRRLIKKSTPAKFKTRNWIVKKKERHALKGIKVRPTTKYTGRKRRSNAV